MAGCQPLMHLNKLPLALSPISLLQKKLSVCRSRTSSSAELSRMFEAVVSCSEPVCLPVIDAMLCIVCMGQLWAAMMIFHEPMAGHKPAADGLNPSRT